MMYCCLFVLGLRYTWKTDDSTRWFAANYSGLSWSHTWTSVGRHFITIRLASLYGDVVQRMFPVLISPVSQVLSLQQLFSVSASLPTTLSYVALTSAQNSQLLALAGYTINFAVDFTGSSWTQLFWSKLYGQSYAGALTPYLQIAYYTSGMLCGELKFSVFARSHSRSTPHTFFCLIDLFCRFQSSLLCEMRIYLSQHNFWIRPRYAF